MICYDPSQTHEQGQITAGTPAKRHKYQQKHIHTKNWSATHTLKQGREHWFVVCEKVYNHLSYCYLFYLVLFHILLCIYIFPILLVFAVLLFFMLNIVMSPTLIIEVCSGCGSCFGSKFFPVLTLGSGYSAYLTCAYFTKAYIIQLVHHLHTIAPCLCGNK